MSKPLSKSSGKAHGKKSEKCCKKYKEGKRCKDCPKTSG